MTTIEVLDNPLRPELHDFYENLLVILLLIKLFTPISFLLYGFLGITISIGTGYLVSLLTKPDNKDLSGLTYRYLNKQA